MIMAERAQNDRGLFAFMLYCLIWMILAVLFGIVLEWCIMTIYHPEEGAYRSLRLLESELSYLENTELIKTGYGYAVIGQLLNTQQDFYGFLSQTLHLQSALDSIAGWSFINQGFAKLGLLSPQTYAVTTLNMINVMTLRMVIIVLSLPIFLVVMVWSTSIGLTQRAIRRYQVRHETSFIFHHAKRIKFYSIAVPVTVYLAWPNELTPLWVFGPAAAVYGLAWLVMASKFKKAW